MGRERPLGRLRKPDFRSALRVAIIASGYASVKCSLSLETTNHRVRKVPVCGAAPRGAHDPGRTFSDLVGQADDFGQF